MKNQSNTWHDNTNQRRPSIAVVSDLFHFSYPISVFQGVTDTAREHGVNVFYMAGGPLGCQTDGTPITRNVIFSLVGPENVDGVLIVSSLLSQYVTRDAFIAFCKQYDPLPVVSVGLTLQGIPSIMIANYTGIYDEVVHLIEAHGYTRIAFIRGPEGHQEAEERFQGYRDALTRHNLPLDPELIVTSEFSRESGRQAITTLLDRRGVTFEAIVAASDQIALGALAALETRGVRVPTEVAIAGFDDIVDARCANPPLTTVRQPYYAMGVRALETLLARLRGEDVPEQIIVPTECIIRESCGCLSREVVYAQQQPRCVNERPSSPRELIAAQTPAILQEIVSVISSHLAGMLPACVDTLLHGFFQDLEVAGANAFVPALNDVLRQVNNAGGDVAAWQHVLSILRRRTVSACALPDQQLQAEHLWQQARLIVDRIALQSYDAQLVKTKQIYGRMSALGGELLTTFDVERLMNVLTRRLPQLGIPSCYLALYEDADAYVYPQPAPAWARWLLAYTGQGQINIVPETRRFPSCWLLPPNSLPTDRPTVMVVTSLDFQNRVLGFVVFEDRLEDKLLYKDLRLQISSALQGALLVQQVQERSAEIARQKYILDTFMANVPDSIYFKDRDSRITQANQAHARTFGLQEPTEEIGKTDFDFFPEEQARPKYEQEQMIIRTGQPMLALEEPGAGGGWSLTTKMPLRDEHGAIIGTFGISRDITELKKAQQALQQANSEISILNAQLQEENVRMSAELDVVKQLQQMILPRPEELRDIPGIDIAGYMQPADEVGGDYYDVLHTNDLLHIGIGDVTGHGLESGVLMLMTQAAIRTLIEHGETDPVKFVNTLNRLIYKNGQRIGTDKNLTFALVQYQQGNLKLVGQHEELLLVRQGGQIERVSTMELGFPVGLEAEISQWVKSATITLQPGDGIILYTDGITEAENVKKEHYGIERLCQVISQSWGQPAEAIKQAVVNDMLTHIGHHTIYDDVTLVVLKQK